MTNTLTIINVNLGDAGNITCEAHDAYSKISETSQVFVYGKINHVCNSSSFMPKPASVNVEHNDLLDFLLTSSELRFCLDEKFLEKTLWAKHFQR